MKKFEFRLQKVLEYREIVESWAKEAYIRARLDRLEAIAGLEGIRERRTGLLATAVAGLNDRLALEQLLAKIDDDERAQQTVIQVLTDEESKSLNEWHVKKQELESLVRLRDHSLEEWNLAASRAEQAELDEWASMRRAA